MRAVRPSISVVAAAITAVIIGGAIHLLSDKKWNFFFLWQFMSPSVDHALSGRKHQYLGSGLVGTIVEFGPGIGSSLPYFASPSNNISRLLLAEPNPYMHDQLRINAEKHGFSDKNMEIHSANADKLPLPNESAEVVVSILVMCSVPNQTAVLKEVQRVLKPGGRFIFMEHVYPTGEHPVARRQADALTRSGIWPAVGDGCHLDRDTGETIQSFGGWREMHIEEDQMPYKIMAAAARHVYGIAVKA